MPRLSALSRGTDDAHYTGEYKDKDWMQHLAPGEVFEGGYVIMVRE